MSIERIKESLKNPKVEYRAIPFWSWNDKLCKEEIKRQIYEMKEKGMGGFFMHSRDGLETEYLGNDWMECVQVALKAAKEVGVKAWLYDEDGFPSGKAGGLVYQKGGEEFSMKVVTLEITKTRPQWNDKILAVFKAMFEDETMISYEGFSQETTCELSSTERLLIFRKEIAHPDYEDPSEASTDLLDPKAVEAFIEVTYEAYKTVAGDEFGNTIPGIFTDEPNFTPWYPKNKAILPWSNDFEAYFLQKRGYSLLEKLPYLFINTKKSAKIRHDYWRTIAERYCTSFTKQIGEWCEKNNLLFTGHYLGEGVLDEAVRAGGSVMPHYRYQQMPGIDILGEHTKEFTTVKQCTSMANQYGKERTICELYACTGWELTFEGQKWIADWLFVLGINTICQHLALYSLRGCRKRDFPPSINYNTSWWEHEKVMEDYFARLSYLLSQGTVERKVLLIHPVSSAWTMLGSSYPETLTKVLGPDGNQEANQLGQRFNQLIERILRSHYDIDLGDEVSIAEAASVKNSKFYINAIGYEVVVVPEVSNLLPETLTRLEEFLDAGGKVIAVKPYPSMLDGKESLEPARVLSRGNVLSVESEDKIPKMLERALPRTVSIQNEQGYEASDLLYMFRELPDSYLLFVLNNDRLQAHEVRIITEVSGEMEEVNILTGEIKPMDTQVPVKGFTALFKPAASKMYIIHKNKGVVKSKSTNVDQKREYHTALQLVSKFTRTQPNALVLDHCAFKIGDGKWSKTQEAWQAQRELRDMLGMCQVFSWGASKRYKWVDKPHERDGTLVYFKFEFNVKELPQNLFLVVEDVQHYQITLNGEEREVIEEGWYLDRSFKKVRLEGVKQGKNELVLTCQYTQRMEFEECYIVGDFALDVKRHMIKEPEFLRLGDWCLQGYLHYCGSMIYNFEMHMNLKKGQRIYLEVQEYQAVTLSLVINGKPAGDIPWRDATTVDISDFVVSGINQIDLVVTGSPRNLLGPLHVCKDHSWTDCSMFRREGDEYTTQYRHKPYGLMKQVNIYKSL